MNEATLEDKVRRSAREVEGLSRNERRELEQAWREAFPELTRDSKGRLQSKWTEKDALELYRGENPGEYFVMPEDWRYPAFRCRGGALPEFGFDGIRIWPGDLTWTMIFMDCDLEGGPYFARREWLNDGPA